MPSMNHFYVGPVVTQDALEPAGVDQRSRGPEARDDLRAKRSNLVVQGPGSIRVHEEIHAKPIPVEIAQDVREPGLNPAPVESAEDVKDAQRFLTSRGRRHDTHALFTAHTTTVVLPNNLQVSAMAMAIAAPTRAYSEMSDTHATTVMTETPANNGACGLKHLAAVIP